MRSRLGQRAGAATALVLAILVAGSASPAAAEAVITIDAPRADPPLESASVTVSGKAESAAPLFNVVKRVTLTIKGKAPFTVECTAQPCPFKWTPSLPLNGPYEVSVAAVEAVQVVGTEGDTSRQVRRFAVAAPPARPVLDTPKVTAGRTVELSWSRNTEPDMLYYAVFRRDPGASRFFQVGGKVTQPPPGTRPTFTDTTTSGFPGGDYSYQVVAVRKGASGTPDTEKLSEPSALAAAAVPAPPTTIATAAPAPGTPAGGPATTVKPGPPAGVDLSGFLSSRAQPVTVAPITVPEPPDTGFSGSLPFGAALPSEELEEGEAEAVPPRDARGSSVVRIDSGRPLVPVAAGLVLVLLAMHMRVLGRRVKAPADHDLAVDLAPHTPTVAVPVAPPADDAPGQNLYDIEAETTMAPDTDWEEDWAAHAAEPESLPAAEVEAEPVPEPEPLPIAEVKAEPLPEPEPVLFAEVQPEPVPEPEPVAEPEPELEITELWAPPEPEPPAYDPDEIEIIEVVPSTRRPLVRAGSR